MEQPTSLMQIQNLSVILEENFSPVARVRTLSQGIQLNNRLVQYEAVVGDKGCLACGNCVDGCPVVREKLRFEFRQNRRTSMSLEDIVGEECRRCYRCVRGCPQVNPEAKEYVTGFRRAEKFIHASLATLIFTLMITGIFLYHYKPLIPELHAMFYGGIHRIAGVLLIILPLVYLFVDKQSFQRLLRNSWSFGLADKEWLTQCKAWLRHPLRDALPAWTEFNPYHKAWICYLCVVVPLLALTGLGCFLGESIMGSRVYAVFSGVHAFVALCTDLLIILHLYFKLLRFLCRNVADMYRYWRKNRDFHYPFLYAKKEAEAAPQTHGGHH